jgi:hypothetical protein
MENQIWNAIEEVQNRGCQQGDLFMGRDGSIFFDATANGARRIYSDFAQAVNDANGDDGQLWALVRDIESSI